ncbi:MAG: hypothetical protein P1P85_02995 [Patescibacteria group bacterium]|nr:hypothetical protein [Patescibacteria group bacterium]
MKISNYIKFFIPSFVFFMMMEFFFRSFGLSQSSLITLFLISILSAFWITKYRFLPIILILLFTSGSVVFLVTLGKNSFQHLYITLISFAFLFALMGLHRFFIQQEHWMKKETMKPKVLDSGFNLNQSIIMISVFLISSGIYSLYIDLDLPLWIMMTIIFITIFFSTIYLTRINFLKSKADDIHLDSIKNKTLNFYSFLSGLIVVELIWAISFLPANHLIIGAIILSVYYSFWNILKDYLRNMLLEKIIISNLFFVLIFLIITIFTVNWEIS